MEETKDSERPTPAEVRLTPETIEYLQKLMTEAVRTGVRESMDSKTMEEFWLSGVAALQHAATQSAGRLVVGGLWSLVKRGVMLLFFGWIVFGFGGWQGLVGFAKLMFAKDGL